MSNARERAPVMSSARRSEGGREGEREGGRDEGQRNE